ncbi:MAG TPA: hydrogenase formation protein HypD [Phycisphaerales bacterium]|nr:hydrogenase formation protein HypD [Phycisphaerales bacterium]
MKDPCDRHLREIRRHLDALKSLGSAPVRIMEVCGTHTMVLARAGLRSLLGEGVRFLSGPGCPVCVTDGAYLERAIHLSRTRPDITLASYGDMVRVPGQSGSLADARCAGADVRVVYSAGQAVEIALACRDRQVVFLAVGFETTAPGTALALRRAQREGLENFSVLTAHKRILPAMRALLVGDDVRVDAFLCPGHVSVIVGWGVYRELVDRFARPCVVAGFEPSQILAGVAEILRQLAEKQPQAASVYPPVSREGNRVAQAILEETFVPADAVWRGLGEIPESGLDLREELAAFDAARRFELPDYPTQDPPDCRCGDVLCGRCDPAECPLFSRRCTPRDPVGACMVSSEGACAAAYQYERFRKR